MRVFTWDFGKDSDYRTHVGFVFVAEDASLEDVRCQIHAECPTMNVDIKIMMVTQYTYSSSLVEITKPDTIVVSHSG